MSTSGSARRSTPSTFTTGDITIVKPDGTTVAATGIQNVGLNRFRISFPAQTLVGIYHVKIGPSVTDLAGNGLDENGNGIGGEPTDVYDGTFNLVQVDLGLSNRHSARPLSWAGDPVTVSWTGQNLTGLPLQGNWIDAVYLSTDGVWDINDTLLATVPHTGGLAQNQIYTGSRRSSCRAFCLAITTSLSVPTWRTRRRKDRTRPTTWPIRDRSAIGVHALTTDGTAAAGSLSPADPTDYYAVNLNGGDISQPGSRWSRGVRRRPRSN